MNLLDGMNQVVQYIEDNLQYDIELEKMAQLTQTSSFEFSRIFAFVAGVPVSEYIRRRRLSQAAYDLQMGKKKVIDVAMTYGYESPTAFTRAFKEQHGVAPSAVLKTEANMKIYPPLSFRLTVRGMEELNVRILSRDAFFVVGMSGYINIEAIGSSYASLWNAKIEDIWMSGIRDEDKVPYDRGNPNDVIITDTKSEIKVNVSVNDGFEGADVPVQHLTSSFEYHATDGKIRATVGIAMDDILPVLIAQGMDQDSVMAYAGLNEGEFDMIPASDWAVFTFTGERNETNMAEAYGRIFTEWFDSSHYTRKEDLPHLERFSFTDGDAAEKTWEIWMPVVPLK